MIKIVSSIFPRMHTQYLWNADSYR